MRILKTSGLAFLLAVSGTHGGAAAQSARAEAVPYSGVMEAVVNGQRRALEQQSVTMRINAGVMQLGSGEMFYELQGVRSSVRFTASDKVHFVMRSLGEGVDPATTVALYRAEPKKKKFRRVKISRGGLSVGMTADLSRGSLAMRFEPAGRSLIRVHPDAPLPAGEYVLVSMASRAFAFGID